jgi:hypothetical protein
MAPSDADRAARLVEEHAEGSHYAALGLAWAALAVAPRDKPAAHRLIERAFRSIHDRTFESGSSYSISEWAKTAGQVALLAYAIDYPDRAALAAHVFAERPTGQDMFSEVQIVEATLVLALLLSPVDRSAARTLLDAAEPHQDVIGSGGTGIGRREYLMAWGLIDPERAVPILLTEIENLKAAGKGMPQQCDLLEVLYIMTEPAAERPRMLARLHGAGWPTGEIDE